MFLTITIQTYNQASGLAQALGCLRDLGCPGDVDYEILVVDNNSTDGTAGVIEEYRGALGPRLRGVFEPCQGLSAARNRAIAEAQGEVLCFLDDDARADPGWLAGHAAVYRNDARVVAVGGKIELQWPAGWSRPAWLAPELEGYLSRLDLGPEPKVMAYPCYPYGCNMSVRRDVARQVGGFSTRLGRQGPGAGSPTRFRALGGSLQSNEEKLFFHQIHRLGGRVVYAPDAVVRHVVPAQRLSKRFFLRRAWAQGLSDVIFRRVVGANDDSGVGANDDWGAHTRHIAFGNPSPLLGPGAAGDGGRPIVHRQSKTASLRAFLGAGKHLATVCGRASVDIVSRRDRAACFLGLARGAYALGYLAGATRITRD